MATLSQAQRKVMIKRVLERQQPTQAADPTLPQIQGSPGVGQTATMESFGEPTSTHNSLRQAEQAWSMLRGVGHSIWGRIHPVSGGEGQPEDSFIQAYTTYLENPVGIKNERVRSFLDSVQRQLGGDDLSIHQPEEQNPALQALSLGDVNNADIG